MMTERDFVYWLQGFFEIANPTSMTPEQVKMVKDHLGYVFEHKQKTETPALPHQDPFDTGGIIARMTGGGVVVC